MIPFENAAAPLPSARRRRLGDGMMEPTRAMEIKDPVTGWFRLIPGVHRVSIDHFAYKRDPQHFKVANSDDTQTVARHRQDLERARRLVQRDIARELAGTTRATTSSRQKRFRLPERRRERFRLP